VVGWCRPELSICGAKLGFLVRWMLESMHSFGNVAGHRHLNCVVDVLALFETTVLGTGQILKGDSVDFGRQSGRCWAWSRPTYLTPIIKNQTKDDWLGDVLEQAGVWGHG
jgi:hypothetical protein